MSVVTPPDVFGIVEPAVYRSNFWQLANLLYIKQLGLKTLVVLSPDKPLRPVVDFCDENGIQMIHLGLSAWSLDSGWKPVSDELVKDALEIVLDASFHPVMLMCSSGIHQTGTLVGCLRRLQNWNLTSILNEYRTYAGSKSRYNNEQFIELFDLDLVRIPPNPPGWFSGPDEATEGGQEVSVSR